MTRLIFRRSDALTDRSHTLVDGEDPYASSYIIYDNANDPLEELSEDMFADLG